MANLSTGLILNNITSALKTQFIEGLILTINKKIVFEQTMSPKQSIPANKNFMIDYQVALSEGAEMFDPAGTLATPGSSQYDNLTGTVKHRNLTLQVLGADLSFSDGNERAFVNVVTNEIQSKAKAEGYEKERIWYGDSTGKIAKISSTTATASGDTITMYLDTTFCGKNAAKWLRRGMLIDIYNGTSAITNATGLTITAVPNQTTVIFNAPTGTGSTMLTAINSAGTAGTGYIYRVNTYANPEYNGLKNLIGVNNNTVLGIDRTTVGKDWFVPYVNFMTTNGVVQGNQNGTALFDWEPEDLRGIISYLITTQGVDKEDMVLTMDVDMEDYLIKQQRNMGEVVARGKFVDSWPYEVVSFNGMPVVSAPLMWANCIFGVNKPGLRKFVNQKLDWQPFEQGYWARVPSTNTYYDAFMAMGVERQEQGLVEPLKNFALWNIKGIRD